MSDVSGSRNINFCEGLTMIAPLDLSKLEASSSSSPRKGANEVDFCDFSTTEIAKALTMIEFEVFLKVFPTGTIASYGNSFSSKNFWRKLDGKANSKKPKKK